MKNQKGFTLVAAMLVVIALTLISLAGWYVLKSQDKTDSEAASQSQSPDENNKESANWVRFSPRSKLYSIKLPDGWVFYHQTDDCDCLLSSENNYKPGTPATIRTTQGGGDGSRGFSIFANDESNTNSLASYESLGTIKTDSGRSSREIRFRTN